MTSKRKLINPLKQTCSIGGKTFPRIEFYVRNSAHPSLTLSQRNLTKTEYKQLNQAWRVLDGIDRINYFNNSDYRILRIVELDKNSANPLLLKSVELAVNIEHSEILKEVA